MHCPELCAGDARVGGEAKGFDQVLELCSDQPIIVFAIYDGVYERLEEMISKGRSNKGMFMGGAKILMVDREIGRARDRGERYYK